MADGEMPNGVDVPKAIQDAKIAAASWSEPDFDLIQPMISQPPDLPLSVLGEWSEWINERAKAASAPADFVALALLTFSAGIVGNSVKVLPQPKDAPDWEEPVALWTALIGLPSSGKTPALKPFTKAIRGIEKRLSTQYAPAIEEQKQAAELAGIEYTAWKSNARKAKEKGEAIPERPAASYPPPEVRVPRIWVMDTTIEALAGLMQHNPNGLFLFRDELFSWLGNMSRYSNGTDQPQWLEFYNGGALMVDRKSQPEPTVIDEALMSVIGGIQPARLNELLEGADDGLFSRFLYIAPSTPELERSDGIKELILELIFQILFDFSQRRETYQLHFSDNAADAFFETRKEIRKMANQTDGLLAGWIGKGNGTIPRLAAILLILDWAFRNPDQNLPTVISVEYVRRATKLWSEYLLPMAKRAFADAALPQVERVGRRILREAQRRGDAVLNEREVRRNYAIEGLSKLKKDQCPFEFLKEAGWLRDASTRGGNTKGRRKKDWALNPLLSEPNVAIGAIGAIGNGL